jgi:hypothetical protein
MINAPTAVSKPTPSPELVAKNAAPGVDQTMLIGILSQMLRPIDSTPYPTSIATIAVAVWLWLAPMALRPAMAIPKVAIDPVVEATVPAR